MKIKKVNELNDSSNFIDKGLNIDKVWTIIKSWDTEISKIYLNKSDAEEACEVENKENYNYYRKINNAMSDKEFDKYFYDKTSLHKLYEVKTLYDAIDLIKDNINDDYTSHDDPNY